MSPEEAQELLLGLADEALSGRTGDVVCLEAPEWPPGKGPAERRRCLTPSPLSRAGTYRVHPWWVMPLSWAGRLSRGSGPVPCSGRHHRGRDRCHDRCVRRPDYAQAGSGADRVRGGKVSTGAFPGPLRRFLAQLDELRSADILDMDQVGRLLVELAADEEYLGPLIAEMPAESPGGKWLVKPDRGPRLILFHRPEGVMAYTHSHHCWVGIAPVRGVETHQRWDAVRHEGGRAELRLADDRAMHRGDVATLTPPGDIHNHGHVLGTGPSPYSLILLGDDMYLYERQEYDPEKGTWRKLAPGDPGRSHR